MGNLDYFTLGRRNLECKNHWEQLASDYFRITKPTVLCFGGNGAIGAWDANAMCKIAQGLMGLKHSNTHGEYATSSDVDFVGIGYGRNEEKGNGTGGLTEKERENFVKNIFLPLCLTESGEIASSEQIVKNFNQITFFAHCYGASEISNLIGKTYREMLKLGVEENTVNEAIDQMFAVSYAPYKKCACPNLQVIPMKDAALPTGAKDSKISTAFINTLKQSENIEREGTVAYKEDDLTVSVLVSNMVGGGMSEHFINFVARNEDWQYTARWQKEYGDNVTMAMGYALARSVSNSINNQNSSTFTPKPTTDEILQDVQDILGETQNSEFETIIEKINLGKFNECGVTEGLNTSHEQNVDPLQPLENEDNTPASVESLFDVNQIFTSNLDNEQ